MISILRISNRVNRNKPWNYWQRPIIFVILIFILFDINTNVSRKWIVKKTLFLHKGCFVSSCKCTHLSDKCTALLSSDFTIRENSSSFWKSPLKVS